VVPGCRRGRLGIELEVLTMTTALRRATVLPEHLVLSLNASPAL
jgi:hypothetical protein